MEPAPGRCSVGEAAFPCCCFCGQSCLVQATEYICILICCRARLESQGVCLSNPGWYRYRSTTDRKLQSRQGILAPADGYFLTTANSCQCFAGWGTAHKEQSYVP